MNSKEQLVYMCEFFSKDKDEQISLLHEALHWQCILNHTSVATVLRKVERGKSFKHLMEDFIESYYGK